MDDIWANEREEKIHCKAIISLNSIVFVMSPFDISSSKVALFLSIPPQVSPNLDIYSKTKQVSQLIRPQLKQLNVGYLGFDRLLLVCCPGNSAGIKQTRNTGSIEKIESLQDSNCTSWGHTLIVIYSATLQQLCYCCALLDVCTLAILLVLCLFLASCVSGVHGETSVVCHSVF